VTVRSVCKLCLNETDIQRSHAIANSVFKKIFRTNSGKAISLTRDERDISYSSDSWWDHQLCSTCEKYLNEEYEEYSLKVLRGNKVGVKISDGGLLFTKVNLNKFNMFFLSVLWRAANSSHSAYKKIVILNADNEYLRLAIKNNTPVPIGRFTVKIDKLIDKKLDGFDSESIKQIIVSPYCRVHETTRVNNISVCFTFEGFFIEIFRGNLGDTEEIRT